MTKDPKLPAYRAADPNVMVFGAPGYGKTGILKQALFLDLQAPDFSTLLRRAGGTVVPLPRRSAQRVDPLAFGAGRPNIVVDLDEAAGVVPLPGCTFLALRRDVGPLNPLDFGPVTATPETDR